MRSPTPSSRSPARTPLVRESRSRFHPVTLRDLDDVPELASLDPETRFGVRVVGRVLPFRVNRYVIEELIDWEAAPDDPIYRLTFPHPEMLDAADYARLADLVRQDAPASEIGPVVREIRSRLNPHPAGQTDLNVPWADGARVPGVQHKYRETVLFFPAQGQTCHAHCTFCFRWPQFVPRASHRFASADVEGLHAHLRAHPEVTDLLITGGDALVLKARGLESIVEPLLRGDLQGVRSVRLGTKALGFWPRRFVTDDDADDLLRLFERLIRARRHVTVMAHVNHGRELEPPMVRRATRRILRTGAVIRTQSPVLAGINDAAAVWTDMWRRQVSLGLVPYYMFVARNTGARRSFELPLARTWQIYREAIQRVSGLARTVRGPSMSADPGKIAIDGVTTIGGERVFVLRFLQARNPDWVHRPFLARFDPSARWIDELEPAPVDDSARDGRPGRPARFFWEGELAEMRRRAASRGEISGSKDPE